MEEQKKRERGLITGIGVEPIVILLKIRSLTD